MDDHNARDSRGPSGDPTPVAAWGPRSALVMSAWFGLVVGLTELGLTLFLKPFHDPSPGFFRMNRNILWTIPTVNLALFGAVGLLLALLARVRPRGSMWLSAFLLVALTLLTFLLTSRRLFAWVCLVLACGLAYRIATRIEAGYSGFRRLVRWSFPVAAAAVFALVGLSLGRDLLRERWAMSLLLPTASNGPKAPNVLLVVLDTVRADRLSLYGYGRDTSPNLVRLAKRGIRFDKARSTAPWTLPSHASIMTGRWPHQLSAFLHGPLDGTHPTLAQFLAANGYATAGFVANTTYCGAETGLGRGFAHYEDHDLSFQGILRTSAVGQRVVWQGLVYASEAIGGDLKIDLRKDAARINHDLLAWTEHVGHRPFFAFLNYVDAHSPYLLPRGYARHFGVKPDSPADDRLLDQWFTVDKKSLGTRDLQLASDAYDDCIAYVDQQLGRLFDELERRGLLRNTLVIVTADHGEQFGEHQLYCHASSLYDPEIHVPLLVIPPEGAEQGRTIAAPVSLRDLPATVADMVGLGSSATFPGQSLALHWNAGANAEFPPLLAEVDGPAKSAPNLGRSPAFRGPMKAVIQGRDVYIRNGDGVEELYDLATDPFQTRNLIASPIVAPKLETFRQTLNTMTVDDNRPLLWRTLAAKFRPPSWKGVPAKIVR